MANIIKKMQCHDRNHDIVNIKLSIKLLKKGALEKAKFEWSICKKLNSDQNGVFDQKCRPKQNVFFCFLTESGIFFAECEKFLRQKTIFFFPSFFQTGTSRRRKEVWQGSML